MIKKVQNTNELILHKVLRKTLIEPNGLTYFDSYSSKFEVKEFVITIEDLGQWNL